MKIEETPFFERPRERCLQTGAESLSLRECIAVILGTGPPGRGCLGLAQELLTRAGEGLPVPEEERAFFTAMESRGTAHLSAVLGLGPAGRARLLATFELGRRYAVFRQSTQGRRGKPLELSRIANQALAGVDPKARGEAQEWLGFVPLHRNGNLGLLCIVERGTRTHVNVDPAELFARVLALRPHGFILFHNHPSGDCRPSSQDLELTSRVHHTSQALGIRLLGHWIISPSGENWLPNPSFSK